MGGYEMLFLLGLSGDWVLRHMSFTSVSFTKLLTGFYLMILKFYEEFKKRLKKKKKKYYEWRNIRSSPDIRSFLWECP